MERKDCILLFSHSASRRGRRDSDERSEINLDRSSVTIFFVLALIIRFTSFQLSYLLLLVHYNIDLHYQYTMPLFSNILATDSGAELINSVHDALSAMLSRAPGTAAPNHNVWTAFCCKNPQDGGGTRKMPSKAACEAIGGEYDPDHPCPTTS